jgi:predicted DCC family thiol-disulfide oxidoreductase YuxK
MDARTEVVFFDGGCGVCHAFVKFVVPRDRKGAFHFAPLGGETFQRVIPAEARATLPDSVVVKTSDGRVLVRSRAVLHVLRELGGGWRVLAAVSWLVPRFLRDAVYDLVAAVRRRIVAPPPDVCPILPPALRSRFAP